MEKLIKPTNGYLALLLSLGLIAAAIYLFVLAGANNDAAYAVPAIIMLLICFVIWKGLMIVQPNHARILNLFGKYVGTIKENGMFFVNPLYASIRITQRVQNMATPTMKVNDKNG